MSAPTSEERSEFWRRAVEANPPLDLHRTEWTRSEQKDYDRRVQKEYERLLYDAYPGEAARDAIGSCLGALGSLALLAFGVWLLGVISRAIG